MKQGDSNAFNVKKESLFLKVIVWISVLRDFTKTLQANIILARNALKVATRAKTTSR